MTLRIRYVHTGNTDTAGVCVCEGTRLDFLSSKRKYIQMKEVIAVNNKSLSEITNKLKALVTRKKRVNTDELKNDHRSV